MYLEWIISKIQWNSHFDKDMSCCKKKKLTFLKIRVINVDNRDD